MKIRLKPIEVDVDGEQWHDARTAYVDIEVGRDRFSVLKEWAEPIEEDEGADIPDGALVVVWNTCENWQQYGRLDKVNSTPGNYKLWNSVVFWKHVRRVTPEDLRRWAGEDEKPRIYKAGTVGVARIISTDQDRLRMLAEDYDPSSIKRPVILTNSYVGPRASTIEAHSWRPLTPHEKGEE